MLNHAVACLRVWTKSSSTYTLMPWFSVVVPNLEHMQHISACFKCPTCQKHPVSGDKLAYSCTIFLLLSLSLCGSACEANLPKPTPIAVTRKFPATHQAGHEAFPGISPGGLFLLLCVPHYLDQLQEKPCTLRAVCWESILKSKIPALT